MFTFFIPAIGPICLKLEMHRQVEQILLTYLSNNIFTWSPIKDFSYLLVNILVFLADFHA